MSRADATRSKARAAEQPGATGRHTGTPVQSPAPVQQEPASQLDDLRASVNQLFAAERRLRSREHSRPGELTHAQLRSIMALGREHEMTAGQLAKSADLTPGTVTAILDQLEEAKIVERRRSTEDRRVCWVTLTPQGWELRERKLAAWRSLWEERLGRFGDKKIKAAMEILHEITSVFDTVSGATSPTPSAEADRSPAES